LYIAELIDCVVRRGDVEGGQAYVVVDHIIPNDTQENIQKIQPDLLSKQSAERWSQPHPALASQGNPTSTMHVTITITITVDDCSKRD